MRQKVAGNPLVILTDLYTNSLMFKYSPWAPIKGQQLRRYQRHSGRD